MKSRPSSFGLTLSFALGACASPLPSPPAPASAQASRPVVDAGASSADAVRGPCEGDDFGLPHALEADIAARYAARRGTVGTATKQIVATSHPLATEAGLAVLRAGGSAADAFVAATLVQDVVLPGVTSTAGLVGALVYEARTKTLTYVHGGVADPVDPGRRWKAGDSAIGKLVLVPGAPAAYAELARRFGRKPLAALVEPAAKLATNGFPLERGYARAIAGNRDKLERSSHGKKTFFRDGKPLAEGATLTLEEFGATLRSYGKDPSWFYKGRWARDAVTLVKENGGTLIARDFEAYAAEVAPPIHGRFLGHDVYGAGHGGVKTLVSLEAYELLRGSTTLPASPATSADALEMLLRVQRATNVVPLLAERDLVMKGSASEPSVVKAAHEVASRVRDGLGSTRTPSSNAAGTHSSAVVVVDSQGNVVAGTHTIETLNWGEGLFVGGIPLSTAAPTSFDDPATAKVPMRIDPLTATIVLKDGAPIVALTVYGTGLHPADVQVLDAVLARGASAEDAVLEPRVGYFSHNPFAGTIDYTKNSVDPRFSPDLLCALKQRGFGLERSMPGLPPGFVDTGFPTLVTIAPGRLQGMTPEMSHIHGVAAGD